MTSRFVLVVLLLGIVGCSRATYIRATVTDNPLDRIAQFAQLKDWSIERVDANTLHLSDAWPLQCILSLGYSASHANLAYNPTEAVMYVQYYLKWQGLVTLLIPMSGDAEQKFTYREPAYKYTMNEQINEILRWSRASVISRRGDWMSDIFPPPRPTPAPP